jgi:Ca2+/Na+ antiporter
MSEPSLLRAWDSIVGSAAFLFMAVIALGLLVSFFKTTQALRHVIFVLLIVLLLLMIPAMLLSFWNALSLSQRFFVLALGAVAAYAAFTLRIR